MNDMADVEMAETSKFAIVLDVLLRIGGFVLLIVLVLLPLELIVGGVLVVRAAGESFPMFATGAIMIALGVLGFLVPRMFD